MITLEHLMNLCLGELQPGDGGFHYSETTLTEIKSVFSALLQGSELKEAARELLMLAFFLETQRASPVAARALVETARLAVPVLEAKGERFDSLVSADMLKRRAALLGEAAKIFVDPRGAVDGKKWWEILGKK